MATKKAPSRATKYETSAIDKRIDKKKGIKENSAKDMYIDNLGTMLPRKKRE